MIEHFTQTLGYVEFTSATHTDSNKFSYFEPQNQVQEWNLAQTSLSSEYISAIYWSVTTLTTVGNGDISPMNDSEVLYSTFAMILGGAFYGYTIAKIATMMQGLDANARVFNERMDAIVSYMRQRDFPKDLFQKVHRYYRNYFEHKTALDEHIILDGLSRSLQFEVSTYLAQDKFRSSYLFSKVSDEILTGLLYALNPIRTAVDEVVFRMAERGDEMYILSAGFVFGFDGISKNVLLEYGPGDVFGEFTTLDVVGGRLFHVQCRSVCDIYSISRSGLEEATHERPMILDELKSKAERALLSLSKKLNLTRRIQILEAIRSRRDTIHRESIVIASEDIQNQEEKRNDSNLSSEPPKWAVDLQRSVEILRQEIRSNRGSSKKNDDDDVLSSKEECEGNVVEV